MTLVEMLVVLTLVGLLAGAVGLGVGSLSRGSDLRAEAEMLTIRLRRASEEALLAAAPVALTWDEGSYRFMSLGAEGWAPHPVPLLGELRRLPDGITFAAAGRFAVTAADLPAEGEPLVLRLLQDRDAVSVTWDGATSTIAAGEAA